ncbi:MAG: DUF2829 domain-containing protein [candidate division Zixibacteria bacterium]|nr:DUF2829 domain-containing protein [candidate division Zixibacteria bacterium]
MRDFGWALARLKEGDCVRRDWWDKWVVLNPGFSCVVPENPKCGKAFKVMAEQFTKESVTTPSFDLFSLDGTIEPGWTPTAEDMLCTEWENAPW